MKKERHIKSFPEKYGGLNLFKEADDYFGRHFKERDNSDLFINLPYIGYLRIDTSNPDFNCWWDETEDDWIQAKVVWVDGNTVWFYYYDSHHHAIKLSNEDHRGFAVKGDVLINIGEV